MPQLYRHQRELINQAPKKHLLAWEMRSGKTATALYLCRDKNEKALIVYPKSVDWEKPIKEWLDTDDYQVLNKKTISKIENKRYYLCTKEFFRDHIKEIPLVPTLCLDEVHHFSGWSSRMYKNALWYAKQCSNIYLLSGTPYRVSPFNIFCLYNLLGYNLNWWKWQNRFYDKVKMGMKLNHRTHKLEPNMVPVLKKDINGHSVEKYLAALVSKIGSTIKFEDIAGEVESEDVVETFTLTAEQKKAIKSLTDTVDIARRGKIIQIISGSLKSDGYNEDQYFKSEKFSRSMDIINNTKKIIVVCRHTLEIKRFKENIKDRKVFVIDGQTSAEERKQSMNDFNNLDDAVVLIQSQICEGFSLISPVMMFYSIYDGFVEYSQMKSRPLMPDRKNSIMYIYMIVDDKEHYYDRACYHSVAIKKQNYNNEIYDYKQS